MNARVLSAFLSFSYVGSVYIFPGARESFRNDASVLWRRIVGVLLFTAISLFCYGDNWESWAGFHGMQTLKAISVSILLVHALYLSPLLANGYPRLAVPKTFRDRLVMFRDYIVGPVTEELVYRGLILSIYRRDGIAERTALRENFLYFGFAHVHHGLMLWLSGDATFRNAAYSSLAHFLMTSLFGTYACWQLVRTNTVWAPIASHMFCNLFGPPPFSSRQVWYIPGLAFGVYAWVQLQSILL